MKTSEQVKLWEKNIDRKAAKVRAERVLTQIMKYNSSARDVLELGVGIGAVLVYLEKKYKVYGLDYLKEYIEIAKKDIPSGKFYVQSMDKLNLNEKFDVIFSVHECINEIKPFKSWEQVFKRVSKHLNYGGLWIFDMRTQKHLEDKKKQQVKLEKTPTGYIYDDFEIKGNKLVWKTTLFKKLEKNLYQIEEDSYFEEVYPANKVKRSLSKYFNILDVLSFENGQKAMFICGGKK